MNVYGELRGSAAGRTKNCLSKYSAVFVTWWASKASVMSEPYGRNIYITITNKLYVLPKMNSLCGSGSS
jgi:hypothetical protein